MNAFNRAFAIFIGALWMGASAAIIYLMWTPSREFSVDNRYIDFLFDLSLSGSDRILATLLAGAALALGLGLIVAQAVPKRPTVMIHEAVPATESRFRELHQRLDALQRRIDDTRSERRAAATAEPSLAAESGRGQPRRRWSLLGRARG